MKIDEIVPVFVEHAPDTLKMGLLYISREYGVAIHLCACGCGEKTVMDFKPHWKDGWELIENMDGTVTFRPSVGNFSGQSPYHAHYYITNNKIEWV